MIVRGLLPRLFALGLTLALPAAHAQSPAGTELYVVALATVAKTSERPATPIPDAFRRNWLYWRVLRSGNAVSYELCLGFFDTRNEAERARQHLVKSFREARVIAVHPLERENLLKAQQKAKPAPPAPPAPSVTPPPTPPRATSPRATSPPAATPQLASPAPQPAPEGAGEALMAEGRSAITREDYAAAVRAFARLLALPESDQSRDAQEFLALAYERRGDTARARLEYENYLKRYPEGEDSVRVRQRLANLRAAPRSETLRAPVQTAAGWRSITVGSVSQIYYHGASKIDTQQVVANTLDRTTLSLTDQSALISSLDLNARFLDETHDNRLVFRDLNTQNFVSGQKDINRLNAAYYEYKYKPADASARLGRQPGSTGGVLGRFDGASLGYGLLPGLRLNLVGGEPFEYGFTIDSKRRFYGVSTDIGPLYERWSGSVYSLQQDIDGITDRRAAGLELRYFAPQGAFISMLDYDTVFRHINIGTMQANWLSPWKTSYNLIVDYRMTPTLQTSTATLGEPSTSVQTLLQTYSEEELRQRARALTAQSALASAGFTHPITPALQLGAAFNVSRISHTDGTSNIPGAPGSGYIYVLTEQVIGTGLFAKRDVTVVSASQLSALTFRGLSWRLGSRAPLAEHLTLEGSVQWYEQTNDNGSKLQRISPTARVGYRWGQSVTLEVEAGAENSTTRSETIEEKTRRNFFSLGYRYDF
jgi:tetratricopeptide (TPR) repeat protein